MAIDIIITGSKTNDAEESIFIFLDIWLSSSLRDWVCFSGTAYSTSLSSLDDTISHTAATTIARLPIGSLAIVVAAVWLIVSSKLLKDVEYAVPEKQTQSLNDDDSHISKKMKILSSASFVLLPVIIMSIAIQGMLRDGISSWVPSFISETFNVRSSISILTSVAMPIFHLVFCLFSWRILALLKNNVYLCIAIYFDFASIMLVLLYFFGFSNLWVSIIIFSVLSAFVHGINGCQTCYLVNYFASTQKVSFISGLLNFSTYIGSAISTYLFALISEKAGWGTNVLCWELFAIVGLLLTLICLFYTSRRLKKEGYKL